MVEVAHRVLGGDVGQQAAAELSATPRILDRLGQVAARRRRGGRDRQPGPEAGRADLVAEAPHVSAGLSTDGYRRPGADGRPGIGPSGPTTCARALRLRHQSSWESSISFPACEQQEGHRHLRAAVGSARGQDAGGEDRRVVAGVSGALIGHGRGQRSLQPAPVASYSSTRARISAFRSSVGSSRS